MKNRVRESKLGKKKINSFEFDRYDQMKVVKAPSRSFKLEPFVRNPESTQVGMFRNGQHSCKAPKAKLNWKEPSERLRGASRWPTRRNDQL